MVESHQDIFLRQAEERDCDLIFNWANDEQVRINSFSSKKILYDDHVKWFKRKLSETGNYFFIFVDKGMDVGLIRLDVKNHKGTISYSIAKDFRGKGYGGVMVRHLEERLKECGRVHKLYAKVKHSNLASQRIFKKLGYKEYAMQDHLAYEKDI